MSSEFCVLKKKNDKHVLFILENELGQSNELLLLEGNDGNMLQCSHMGLPRSLP